MPPSSLPPAADGGDNERGGVVISADTDPAGVRGDVVDPIRDRLVRSLPVQEVVCLDQDRLTGRPPLVARVLVVADEFLLLRVHADFFVSTLITGCPVPIRSLAHSLM